MAYLSYLLAEMFHFSGIISIICCGLVQSQYACENISSKSFITVHYFSKVASSVSESLIFIILGVMLVTHRDIWAVWHAGFSIYSLILCFVIRYIGLRWVAWGSFFLAGVWSGCVRGAIEGHAHGCNVPHHTVHSFYTRYYDKAIGKFAAHSTVKEKGAFHVGGN